MSTSIGNEAESKATEHLKSLGYEIIDRNWRTRVCEIDIIAKKTAVVYFVEVKYRSSLNQGGGLEYITPAKLKQMQFAATCWVEDQNYTGDYELSAIELSGDDYKVTSFLPNVY